jgi:hypothetical protein
VNDKFRFSADTSAKLVRMPVLYQHGDNGGIQTKRAFANPVNSLVDQIKSLALAAKPFGPHVLPGDVDIFEDYGNKAFALAGIADVLRVDTKGLERHDGSIHCATTAIREIPERSWWDA